MKKSLVALAAVAATGAMAQVTIDGYMDRGYLVTNNSFNQADTRTVGSNAGTTTFGIKYRENVGGGIVVGGQVNTDWSDIGGNTQANSLQPSQTSGFANSQSFVDIAGPFGTIRAGVPNNFTLTNATAVATPAFSTGVGSSYSSSFSIANGLGTGSTGYGGVVVAGNAASTAAVTGARAIRIANTVQYSSPDLNGLTAHFGYTPQNNNVDGSSGTSSTGAGNTVGVTEYALRYTNGPIDAMYTSIKYEVGSLGVSRAALTAAGVATNGAVTGTSTIGNTLIAGGTTSTQNLLGASYAVNGALKLHAGFGSFSSANNANKGKSTDFGATYTLGSFVFMGHIAKVDDQSTTNYDRKLTGLGVDYNLSKTARLYVRYDDINYAANQASFTGSSLKRTAVGFSKSF
jgi:predicted porin